MRDVKQIQIVGLIESVGVVRAAEKRLHLYLDEERSISTSTDRNIAEQWPQLIFELIYVESGVGALGSRYYANGRRHIRFRPVFSGACMSCREATPARFRAL